MMNQSLQKKEFNSIYWSGKAQWNDDPKDTTFESFQILFHTSSFPKTPRSYLSCQKTANSDTRQSLKSKKQKKNWTTCFSYVIHACV